MSNNVLKVVGETKASATTLCRGKSGPHDLTLAGALTYRGKCRPCNQAANIRYRSSPMGRAKRSQYNCSPKGQVTNVRYHSSTKGILTDERYYQRRKRGEYAA